MPLSLHRFLDCGSHNSLPSWLGLLVFGLLHLPVYKPINLFLRLIYLTRVAMKMFSLSLSYSLSVCARTHMYDDMGSLQEVMARNVGSDYSKTIKSVEFMLVLIEWACSHQA